MRSKDDHRRAFSLTPEYLVHAERGLAGGSLWFSEYGVQLSRGFRALKVWMSLKEHGVHKFGRMVQQNMHQAQYLAGLVDSHPHLERLAPVQLNIVCFRYNPGVLDNAALNALNLPPNIINSSSGHIERKMALSSGDRILLVIILVYYAITG